MIKTFVDGINRRFGNFCAPSVDQIWNVVEANQVHIIEHNLTRIFENLKVR